MAALSYAEAFLLDAKKDIVITVGKTTDLGITYAQCLNCKKLRFSNEYCSISPPQISIWADNQAIFIVNCRQEVSITSLCGFTKGYKSGLKILNEVCNRKVANDPVWEVRIRRIRDWLLRWYRYCKHFKLKRPDRGLYS